MANAADTISLKGLRKALLRQLSVYIRDRDNDGRYYGPRDQFGKRHADSPEPAARTRRGLIT